MGSIQGDDAQLNGNLGCQSAEIRSVGEDALIVGGVPTVTLEANGIPLAGSFSALNFIGATIMPSGTRRADINAGGGGGGALPVNNTWDTPLTADGALALGVTFVQVDPESLITFLLPPAAGNEGQLVAVNARVGDDGTIAIEADGADTVEGQSSITLDNTTPSEVAISVLLVSDGVNTWGVVADREIVHVDPTLSGTGTSSNPLTIPATSASWIALIASLSTADVPIEWLSLFTPGLSWTLGDVVTIDFQIHSPGVSFSLFLAQGGTFVPASPVINGTSVNPWTGRLTLAIVGAIEARMWSAMLVDSAGISLEINVPSPPATFTINNAVPLQLMIVSNGSPVAFAGTLTARLSTGAALSVA